jgi:hypothetical protein
VWRSSAEKADFGFRLPPQGWRLVRKNVVQSDKGGDSSAKAAKPATGGSSTTTKKTGSSE